MSSNASPTTVATSTVSTRPAPSGSGSRSGNAGSSAEHRRGTRRPPARAPAGSVRMALTVPTVAAVIVGPRWGVELDGVARTAHRGREGIRTGAVPTSPLSSTARRCSATWPAARMVRPAGRTRAALRRHACRDRHRQDSCSRIGGLSAGARGGSERRLQCHRHPCPGREASGPRTLTWYGRESGAHPDRPGELARRNREIDHRTIPHVAPTTTEPSGSARPATDAASIVEASAPGSARSSPLHHGALGRLPSCRHRLAPEHDEVA